MGLKYEGLKDIEVASRVEKGLVNKSVKNTSKTNLDIIRENFLTYFNLIFLVLAILFIAAGYYKGLTFIPLVLLNTLIGIVQEIKSKKLIDKLSFLSSPKTNAIRNGKIIELDTESLVEDDIVIFSAGNQIPADAVVIDGHASLNESLLTGEADEIEKGEGDKLMSGSFVVSGSVTARLTNVGADSYISKLTLKAKEFKNKEDSEIIKSLNKILGLIGIIIIPIAIILMVEGIFIQKKGFNEATASMGGSILMMIPEGLFLLASASLAISAYRLAKKNVLIQSMNSIETLARVNVLCIDKTGTITNNHMSVTKFVPLNGADESDLFKDISSFVKYQNIDNATMEALKVYFNDPNDELEFVDKISFSSKYKYSAIDFKQGTYIIGAPEFVISNYDDYKKDVEVYARDGYRVLAFLKTDEKINEYKIKNATPYGLIILENAIRENAKETFEYFASQGVDIKVISGDDALTVSNVAKRAGIKNSDKYIDTTNLKDEDIDDVIKNYNVFGRVTPELKLKFVKSLKKQGNKVAMTGDGVNDVLALKEADCSIAMSEGADAAIKTSKVVLVDSDFSHMPHIVYEGRRVVNNLERSGSIFITKNIFSILLTLVCIISNIPFPIKTTQTGLINTFAIGVPAFMLSQVPNKNIIKGRFVPNILKYALPAGITEAITVGIFIFVGKQNSMTSIEINCVATMLMAVVGTLVIINISRPFTKYKLFVIIFNAVFLVVNIILAFLVPLLKEYYDFKILSKKSWIIWGIFSISSVLLFVLLTFLFNKIKIKTPKYMERMFDNE